MIGRQRKRKGECGVEKALKSMVDDFSSMMIPRLPSFEFLLRRGQVFWILDFKATRSVGWWTGGSTGSALG